MNAPETNPAPTADEVAAQKAADQQAAKDKAAADKEEAKQAKAALKQKEKEDRAAAKEQAKKDKELAKQQAAEAKKAKDVKNGVNRPMSGVTALVWKTADDMSQKAGKPIGRAELTVALEGQVEKGTVHTQYGRWCKYYGLSETREARRARLEGIRSANEQKKAAAKAEKEQAKAKADAEKQAKADAKKQQEQAKAAEAQTQAPQ